jgi:hypothetical protein
MKIAKGRLSNLKPPDMRRSKPKARYDLLKAKAGERTEVMSENMIERMAKALFLDRFPDSEDYWPDRVGACELGSADDYRGYARTAINEMREPTKEMTKLFDEADRLWCGDYPVNSTIAEMAWEMMVDAALKEKDPTAD